MIEEILKCRIRVIADAQSRSRLFLFATALTCLILIGALFNEFLSWDAAYSYEKMMLWKNSLETKTGPATLSIVDQQVIKNWVDSQTVSVGLLGIRFSVDDVQFLGPLALIFLTFILSLQFRRENREIARILRDFRYSGLEHRQLVFAGIKGGLIFTSLDGPGGSYSSLDQTEPSEVRRRFVDILKLPGMKTVSWFLFQLPILTVTLIFISDLYFLFFYESPFRLNEQPNYLMLQTKWWRQLSIWDTFALLSLIPIGTFCGITWRSVVGTSNLMRQFEGEMPTHPGGFSYIIT